MRQARKWLRPGLYVKRWLLAMVIGLTLISISIAYMLVVIFVAVETHSDNHAPLWFELLTLSFLPIWMRVLLPFCVGLSLFWWGVLGLNRSLLGPLLAPRSIGDWADFVHYHHQLRQGIRVAVLGGGTGIPSILRAMKTETSNITAVVTVADDGGSSGRLRRDFGMPPPGDLRNNIAALARDEDLMTHLLNYRFDRGELDGHTFGNIFLAALVKSMGGMDVAAQAAGRVLAIQGQVLPCTLENISLIADVRHPKTNQLQHIEGESNISSSSGYVENIAIVPSSARALPAVMRSLIAADLIVLGPGSLFTSVLPNLLVHGVAEAIRTSNAVTVYVCNIATQPGETESFNVADHVKAIEKYVGTNLIDVVIANNHYPEKNKGKNTIYVKPAPADSARHEEYRILYTDLTDEERPWRHDPAKLRKALLTVLSNSSLFNNKQRADVPDIALPVEVS